MKNFLIVGIQITGSSAIAKSIGFNPMVTSGRKWTLGVTRRNKFKIAENDLGSNFTVLNKADQDHMDNVHNANKFWLGFRWLFFRRSNGLLTPVFR